jgi:hypothetical protein
VNAEQDSGSDGRRVKYPVNSAGTTGRLPRAHPGYPSDAEFPVPWAAACCAFAAFAARRRLIHIQMNI